MSSPADPTSQPTRRRRRINEPKGWKAVPKVVKILLPICVVIVVLIPMAVKNGWIRRAQVDTTVLTSSGPSGLMIAEAALDPASRTIKGVVSNTSKNSYRDVQVSYYV